MTRTVAPKDLGGRLLRNLARTTPELPVGKELVYRYHIHQINQRSHRIP